MKTIIKHIFFLRGDEILEVPEKGTKCYRCGQDIGTDNKSAKIASLIVKDDDVTVNWNWFCSKCAKEFNELMRGVR